MSIDEEVKQQLQDAMRARDTTRLAALRMIRAALIEAAKSGLKGGVTDEVAVETIRRLRKQRLESAEAYELAGRAELAAIERAEASLAETFLPKTADEAQTRLWVEEAMAATGSTSLRQLGRVMGHLMKNHKGELDAALARQLLEQMLSD